MNMGVVVLDIYGGTMMGSVFTAVRVSYVHPPLTFLNFLLVLCIKTNHLLGYAVCYIFIMYCII